MADIRNIYYDTLVSGTSNADSIQNSGSKVTIDADDGKDTISNDGTNVIIDSGNGNDSIINAGTNVLIDGGEDNDTIRHYSSNASIIGGTGGDLISLASYSQNNLIKYRAGDGNDTIYGFNATSTLQIGGSSYSTQISGSNIITTIGDGSIILVGAASLASANINDIPVSIPANAFEYNGHSYYIYSDVAETWEEAQNYCETRGGHLAVINDEAENTMLFNYMDSLGYQNAYFGLSDAANEGTWTWVTGEPVTYINWHFDIEPNNGDGYYPSENYANFICGDFWNDDDFGLYDYLDDSPEIPSFICEWDTVKTIEDNKIALTEGNDTLKETVDGATIQALGGNDTIRSYGDAAQIDSGAGNDSIRNYGDNVSINAGADNDIIRNYGDDVTITGGTGNDTIRNAFGENVLFNYSAGDGNDVIIGFNESSTLKIGNGTATYSTVKSGNNIIVTAGSGKLTLQGAATLDTLNIAGTKKTYKTLTLTDKSSDKITLPSTYIAVKGSKRTKAIKVTGNSLDNTITGGTGKDTLTGGAGADSLLGSDGNDKLYGGSGDDTLFGGMGNDSLWGQVGADTFLYTEGTGKDVIYGFDNDDMLQITGDWTALITSTGAVSFKVGSTYNSIVLKSFTATTFNVNGESYEISNNKFVKK